jgi:hypothetical protein
MFDNKKNSNINSENKTIQEDRCVRNALNQELIKFKLSLIEYVSANKLKLNINEKEIEILLNKFIVELYKKCGFYNSKL